jgi:hypothetical protein
MNNKVYFHVCVYGDKWLSIYHEMMTSIIASGLIDQSTVYVNYNGDVDLFEHTNNYSHKNLVFKNIGSGLFTWEFPTLVDLYNDALNNENTNYLYIHTKGVSRREPSVEGWRKYMTYFNVSKWSEAIVLLKEHNAVGVDFQEGNPHSLAQNVGWFAGNFWWSKSEHIKKLINPSEIANDRLLAEFWIGSKDKDTFISMWQSNNNHYQNYYEEKNYKKK